MERVAHDGRTTAYRLADGAGGGPGAALNHDDGGGVLYVHGSGGTSRVWAAQYGPAGPVHPAVAVDLSGHGESDDVTADPGPETLDAYVDDVVAVAEETDVDVLVGNSLGGAVALRAVLEDRLDPSALVLAGTGAKLGVGDDLLATLDDDFEGAIETLHDPDRLFHDAPDRLVARSKEQLRATGRRVTRRDFLTCDAFDVRDRLGEVATPTLALCGEHDRLTPPDYHEYLAENVRHGECHVLDDASHLAMVERPTEFGEAVESFVADFR